MLRKNGRDRTYLFEALGKANTVAARRAGSEFSPVSPAAVFFCLHPRLVVQSSGIAVDVNTQF